MRKRESSHMKESSKSYISKNLPKHWQIIRLKNVLIGTSSGSTPASGDNSYYSDNENDMPWVSIGDMGDIFTSSTKNRITQKALAEYRFTIVPSGTLLYSMYASVGFVSELTIDATTNQAILALYLDDSKCDKLFIKYWLNNMRQHINRFTSTSTQSNLNANKVISLDLYLPPLAEQKRIAAFLDERTGKIDSLVQEFAKFKANLQLQKCSLVSECVTKGLPSERDRSYKDSGVEWLGEVPASWEISKVKYVAKLTTGNTPEGKSDEYFAEAGTPWIRPSNISDADIVSGEILMLSNEGRNTVRLIPANSVAVVCIGATLGKIGLVDSEFATNQQINTITYNDLVFYKYGFYFNLALHDEYVRTGMSVTLPIMNKTQHGKIIHVVPPLDEQQCIADYLDSECAKIDALIGEIDNQVNLLKTYRKSLINEAVTGKIEV